MNLTARVIPILIIIACLCAACQQSTTSSPDEPTTTGLSTQQAIQPSPDTPTPSRQPTEVSLLNPDDEEYAVYAALIENSFRGDWVEQVLIMDHTRVNSPELLEKDLAEIQEKKRLDKALVDSFLERNQQPFPLKPAFEMKLAYQLLTQEEVDAFRPLDEESGWKLFYEKFPNAVGYIYLSRVGFNADLSQALVYYEHYHYDQPIRGGYCLMTREEGSWVCGWGYEWMT